MDNQGGVVGPHLDGVGNRGLERLIEDVLDPSRNVDPSFRYSTVSLKNGEVFSGLQRREEGAVAGVCGCHRQGNFRLRRRTSRAGWNPNHR